MDFPDCSNSRSGQGWTDLETRRSRRGVRKRASPGSGGAPEGDDAGRVFRKSRRWRLTLGRFRCVERRRAHGWRSVRCASQMMDSTRCELECVSSVLKMGRFVPIVAGIPSRHRSVNDTLPLEFSLRRPPTLQTLPSTAGTFRQRPCVPSFLSSSLAASA